VICGVVFIESVVDEEGHRTLRGHGPKSIYEVAVRAVL